MKTKEEILNQLYISAEDLRVLIPMGKVNAVKAINELQADMKKLGYYVPNTKKHLALTKLVRKKYGF